MMSGADMITLNDTFGTGGDIHEERGVKIKTNEYSFLTEKNTQQSGLWSAACSNTVDRVKLIDITPSHRVISLLRDEIRDAFFCTGKIKKQP